MTRRPRGVIILGIPYEIIYCDRPADVDYAKRQLLDGQIDFWNREIRIHDSGQPDEHIWQVIMHEILHAIVNDMHLSILSQDNAHEDLDCLALALVDTLIRNKWLEVRKK